MIQLQELLPPKDPRGGVQFLFLPPPAAGLQPPGHSDCDPSHCGDLVHSEDRSHPAFWGPPSLQPRKVLQPPWEQLVRTLRIPCTEPQTRRVKSQLSKEPQGSQEVTSHPTASQPLSRWGRLGNRAPSFPKLTVGLRPDPRGSLSSLLPST